MTMVRTIEDGEDECQGSDTMHRIDGLGSHSSCLGFVSQQ
jgi:hypothetical protein